MKKTIKTLQKMYNTNSILFDGIFYSIVIGNKVTVVRPIGNRFIIEKRMAIA